MAVDQPSELLDEFPISGWDSYFDGKNIHYSNWGSLIQQKVYYQHPIAFLGEHCIGKLIRGRFMSSMKDGWTRTIGLKSHNGLTFSCF